MKRKRTKSDKTLEKEAVNWQRHHDGHALDAYDLQAKLTAAESARDAMEAQVAAMREALENSPASHDPDCFREANEFDGVDSGRVVAREECSPRCMLTRVRAALAPDAGARLLEAHRRELAIRDEHIALLEHALEAWLRRIAAGEEIRNGGRYSKTQHALELLGYVRTEAGVYQPTVTPAGRAWLASLDAEALAFLYDDEKALEGK